MARSTHSRPGRAMNDIYSYDLRSGDPCRPSRGKAYRPCPENEQYWPSSGPSESSKTVPPRLYAAAQRARSQGAVPGHLDGISFSSQNKWRMKTVPKKCPGHAVIRRRAVQALKTQIGMKKWRQSPGMAFQAPLTLPQDW